MSRIFIVWLCCLCLGYSVGCAALSEMILGPSDAGLSPGSRELADQATINIEQAIHSYEQAKAAGLTGEALEPFLIAVVKAIEGGEKVQQLIKNEIAAFEARKASGMSTVESAALGGFGALSLILPIGIRLVKSMTRKASENAAVNERRAIGSELSNIIHKSKLDTDQALAEIRPERYLK